MISDGLEGGIATLGNKGHHATPKKGGADVQGDVIHAEVIGGAPVESGAKVGCAARCAQLLCSAKYGVRLLGAS